MLIEPWVSEDGEDRRRQAEGYRGDEDEGAGEAFELAGEHEQHDDQREDEGLDDAAGGAVQLLGLAGEDQAVVGRQDAGRQRLQLVHGLAQVDAVAERGADRDGAALVLARQARRHRRLLEGDQRGQRHHLAVLGAQLHVVERARVLDHAVGQLGEDLDRVVADVEVAEVPAAEDRLHRGGNRVDRDADLARPLAVDLDRHLRLGGVVVELDAVEGRVLLHRLDELVGDAGELVVFGAGDGELQALPAAADAEAVGGAGEDLDAGDLLQLAVQLGR